VTAHQQTLYTCDGIGCSAKEYTPMAGSAPLHERAAGPEGWTMLRIGADPSTPPAHLCPACTTKFTSIYGSQKGTGA
jgi:hypothetical protein